MAGPDLAALSERFRRFGERECVTSPLYQQLCFGVAADLEVLKLASHTPPGQPAPNLLFAAAKYLAASDSALAALYAQAASSALSGDPYPVFRRFVLRNADAVVRLMSARRVQTNEARRALFLLAGLSEIARRIDSEPFNLVEIGASAGLNLLWQRYGYDYGGQAQLGLHDAPLVLRTEVRGTLPPVGADFPAIIRQVGIALHPLDPMRPDDRQWLRALVWPEHVERIANLNAALSLARVHPPTLLAGDALDLLPELFATMPADEPVVVFHSFVLYQFTDTMRGQLDALLGTQARPVYRLGVEWEQVAATIRLYTYTHPGMTDEILAHVEPHGSWIDWIHPGSSRPPSSL